MSIPSYSRLRVGSLALGLAAVVAMFGVVTVSAQGSTADHPASIHRGQAAVSAHHDRFGSGPGQSLKALAVYRDHAGTTIRFERSYRGLLVVGGELIVHLTPAGSYRYGNGVRVAAMPSSVRPTVSAGAASTTVEAARRYSVAEHATTLVVYATASRSTLAWQVNTSSADHLHGDVAYVSASTGRVLAGWKTVESDNGLGKTLYVGKVRLKDVKRGKKDYVLQDNRRGGQQILDAKNNCSVGSGTLFEGPNDKWGNFTNSNRETAGADAAYGLANTWDFYLDSFGRKGIADDGRAARAFVHYCSNYANANWSDSCFCMIFGDGSGGWGPLVTLDVAGHEMSHGVTSRTAGLIYSGESGGLNESTSDVMGTMVEWYANSTDDVPDYMIGEEFYLQYDPEHNYLRRFDQPSLDGASKDCWYNGVGNVDVHYSSGVGNHFFYLLSEGSGSKTINGLAYDSPTCDGSTVTGIGHDEAAAIWYKALTEQWVPTTNYHDARVGTLNAAAELYGSESTEYDAVNAAWAAVSVTP